MNIGYFSPSSTWKRTIVDNSIFFKCSVVLFRFVTMLYFIQSSVTGVYITSTPRFLESFNCKHCTSFILSLQCKRKIFPISPYTKHDCFKTKIILTAFARSMSVKSQLAEASRFKCHVSFQNCFSIVEMKYERK